MKIQLLLATSLLVAALAYLLVFKTADNEYILSHGWKGGGCGLPDVLDFRHGTLVIRDNALYENGVEIGHIVSREYRFYADSCVEVRAVATGQTCSYWNKWKN